MSLYALGTRLFPGHVGGAYDPSSGYQLAEPIGYWNALGLLTALAILLALGFATHGHLATRSARRRSRSSSSSPRSTSRSAAARSWRWPEARWCRSALDPRRARLLVSGLVVSVPAALGVLEASRSHALTAAGATLQTAQAEGSSPHTAPRRACARRGRGAGRPATSSSGGYGCRSGQAPSSSPRPLLAAGLVDGRRARRSRRAGHRGGTGCRLLHGAAPGRRRRSPASPAQRLGERTRRLLARRLGDGSRRAVARHRRRQLRGALAAGAPDLVLTPAMRTTSTSRRSPSSALLGLASAPRHARACRSPRSRRRAVSATARRPPGHSSPTCFTPSVDWDWEVPAVTLAALFCAAALLASPPRSALLTGRRVSPHWRWRRRCSRSPSSMHVGNRATAASIAAIERGDPDRALAQAQRAIDWAPWSDEPWQLRGEAELLRRGRRCGSQEPETCARAQPGELEHVARSRGCEPAAQSGTQALAEAKRLNPLSQEADSNSKQNLNDLERMTGRSGASTHAQGPRPPVKEPS